MFLKNVSLKKLKCKQMFPEMKLYIRKAVLFDENTTNGN